MTTETWACNENSPRYKRLKEREAMEFDKDAAEAYLDEAIGIVHKVQWMEKTDCFGTVMRIKVEAPANCYISITYDHDATWEHFETSVDEMIDSLQRHVEERDVKDNS